MGDFEKDMRRSKRKCVMLCMPNFGCKDVSKNGGDVVSLILCCLRGFYIRLTDKQAEGLYRVAFKTANLFLHKSLFCNSARSKIANHSPTARKKQKCRY